MTSSHELSLHLDEPQRRELRRWLAISALAHLALIGAFAMPTRSTISVPRGVVAVELVAAPTRARPAAPAPAKPAAPAKPIPEKPAPPKPKKVVLPAEPTAPKVEPKPKPKVAEEPPPVKPAPAAEQQYEDVLAQLRAEAGDDAPTQEIAQAAPAVIGTPGSPHGVAVSPEVAAWLKRAKIHVRKNWVLSSGFRTQALETHVEVELGAGGEVRGAPRVTRRSGNPWYDEGVIRAIQKSSPLPPPPEAGRWSFVFLPEDSY